MSRVKIPDSTKRLFIAEKLKRVREWELVGEFFDWLCSEIERGNDNIHSIVSKFCEDMEDEE